MRVRLGQCRPDPEGPRREHHRPADVAPGTENRVGSAAAQDARAGGRRDQVTRERPREAKAEAPREALDPEGVELEAGGAREPLLDGVRPTGERDVRAAAPQRLGDCECRQDVPGGPARGDQEPWRWTRRRHG